MKDLGYANGWKETPDEIRICDILKHRQSSRKAGKCLTEYGCEKCEYKYLVDSSD